MIRPKGPSDRRVATASVNAAVELRQRPRESQKVHGPAEPGVRFQEAHDDGHGGLVIGVGARQLLRGRFHYVAEKIARVARHGEPAIGIDQRRRRQWRVVRVVVDGTAGVGRTQLVDVRAVAVVRDHCGVRRATVGRQRRRAGVVEHNERRPQERQPVVIVGRLEKRRT